MYKLTSMLFQLKMDRKINPDIHYLSPEVMKSKKMELPINLISVNQAEMSLMMMILSLFSM